MSLYLSEDPVMDAERYMMAQDIRLARRPVCDCCENHIQEESALHYVTRTVDIWLCEECVESNMEYIEVD
jgi:hypothetical protein